MANRTRFAGWYRASDYYFGAPGPGYPPALTIVTAPVATGSGTVTLSSGTLSLTDGTNVTVPLATNAPVSVGVGSNVETVTPSAVNNIGNAMPGVAGFTATFTKLHGTGDLVSSGTCGLQEAINDCNSRGGGTVAVDNEWTALGGTAAMYTAAVLPAHTVLLDNRK